MQTVGDEHTLQRVGQPRQIPDWLKEPAEQARQLRLSSQESQEEGHWRHLPVVVFRT